MGADWSFKVDNTSEMVNTMDEKTGPVAYREAGALVLINKLKILRQRVKEARGDEIDGFFNGILRVLGSEMQRIHGKYGER